jgi:heme/copper-type cytochrome/quinol oxidase subunit 2
MTLTRRTLGLMLLGTGVCLVAGFSSRLFAQEQAPNRREFVISARDYRFSPDRIEVTQDDLVKLTVESGDVAYSFTIDEYRLSRRVPAGGKTVIEFRADQVGTFDFYSNMTSDARHAKMRGQLSVRRK